MFEWIKELFCGRTDPAETRLNEDGSLPISQVGDDQVEFKTYAEAMSWVFQTGKPAVFNWDDKKQLYIRG